MLLNSPDLHIIHATIDLLLAVVNSPFSERINHSEVCALVDTLDVNDVVAMQQANIDDQVCCCCPSKKSSHKLFFVPPWLTSSLQN